MPLKFHVTTSTSHHAQISRSSTVAALPPSPSPSPARPAYSLASAFSTTKLCSFSVMIASASETRLPMNSWHVTTSVIIPAPMPTAQTHTASARDNDASGCSSLAQQ